MTLTIYTSKFDSRENVYGTGMSGKVFLEENGDGMEFRSLDDALDYAHGSNTIIDRILIKYLSSDGGQMFRWFNIKW